MKKYGILLLVGLVLFSCRKDELEAVDGPNLTDVFGTFEVVSTLVTSQPNVDFAAGQSVYFTSEISIITDWELKITGQTSGAEKIITGTGKIIDASVSTWDGSTTNFPMFQSETCDVMLTFPGEADTLYSTVTVDQPKTNSGFVIADFESGWVGGWTSFIQSGGNMDFNIKTDGSAAQLGSYYNMQGLVDWDWLVGMVNFNAAAYGSTTIPLSSNADNLYFNVLIYGQPGLPNSRVLFQFDEDDDLGGSFNAVNEDQFTIEILIDWEGWRKVSVKYSDLIGNGAGGGTHNPDKINAINMLHLADPSSGIAVSKIDYIIFTENAALNP
ncbi:MAG: hypothetical protein ACJASQ_001679 [Crocinitomicaceae bacterium]|jgi:hypothetical protein